MIKKIGAITFTICLLTLLAFIPSKNQELDSVSLGTYSISLNVKDISASNDFYHKLGFAPIEGMGAAEQRWMILTNGRTKIGLFQGMFPSNTMTFNPEDARSIHNVLEQEGIKPTFQTGLDENEGPCTFSIVDPDGNPILIDQH